MDRRTFLQTMPALMTGLPEPPRRSPVIDVHCHAGRGMHYGAKPDTADPWTTFNDPRWLLEQADAAGVDRCVIFPITNRTYERANEEIAEYVRRWPERFIGFAKHDPVTEAGRIERLLRREVEEFGLRGLKLHGIPTAEMLRTAAELELPVLVHPPRVAPLVEVARRWPAVNFILAHLGSFASRDWREHLAAIRAARELPNLYLETSAVVFFPYLHRAAREVPPEKLLFGSDGPLTDIRVEIHKIKLLQLPSSHEQLVLGLNAARLLKLETASR